MRKEITVTIVAFDKETNEKHVTYMFPLDAGKDHGCYRSRMSISAFFSYKRTRYINKKHNIEFWRVDDGSVSNTIITGMSTTPVIFLDSVWDFYNEIGYDYKTKKYIDRPIEDMIYYKSKTKEVLKGVI